MEGKSFLGHIEDGRVVLDDPCELETGAKVFVTLVPIELQKEREEWASISLASLARGYSDDEPDYSDAIIEVNPDYEGG